MNFIWQANGNLLKNYGLESNETRRILKAQEKFQIENTKTVFIKYLGVTTMNTKHEATKFTKQVLASKNTNFPFFLWHKNAKVEGFSSTIDIKIVILSMHNARTMSISLLLNSHFNSLINFYIIF